MSGLPEAPTLPSAGHRLPLVPVATRAEASRTGTWRQERPLVDLEKCNRCRICVKYCPCGVMTVDKTRFIIDWDYCKGCGICADVCPPVAIAMVPEGAEG